MFTASLDYCYQYCNHGLAKVLPLHFPVPHQGGLTCSCSRSNCPSPAKHPLGHLVPNGLSTFTQKKKIEYWFRDSSWNVGIVTGHPSGIIALDIDPRHGGNERLHPLRASTALCLGPANSLQVVAGNTPVPASRRTHPL